MIVGAVLLAATLLVAHDAGSRAGNGIGARLAILAIDTYRGSVSPRISGYVTCRFKPTCSAYGRAAIARYGLLRGGAKAGGRILRCGPWTPAGTVDLP